MKLSRTISLLLAMTAVLCLLAACTGDVPEPYVQDKVLAEANINTKIVILEESEDSEEPTEKVLLDRVVNVTSTTKPALSLKDLLNTLNDENIIPVTLVFNRITSIENYEATDTHMWFWSINGNGDAPIAGEIKEGTNVVLTYAEKTADLATDDAGNVLTMTVSLSIKAGNDTIYSGDYTVEGENSISVKEILRRLRDDEKAFDLSVAGSIKSINDYKKSDTRAWNIYVDGEQVKPSSKVKDGNKISIRFEEVEV